MKAFVRTQFGPPNLLQFTEVAKPIPQDNEVLIKLFAASVNPMDLFPMRGMPVFRLLPGRRKPKDKILGCDVAGRIEAVGSHVKQFKPGDDVFGGTGVGGFAEFVCAKENSVALKPAKVSFEASAAVTVAGLTALQGLRDHGRIQPGHKVLIEGASGGVGTFAIQIAKSFGAEVTAVCSTRNVERARSLGADHVIDYTCETFTKSEKRYDLIVGANAHRSIFAYKRSLSPEGTYVLIGGSLPRILQGVLLAPLLSRMGRKKMRFFIAKISQKDLVFLAELLESGKIVSVIDRRYPLSGVPEALRYLEERHAQGKIVINIEHAAAATP
jgi:NADPH:quinone reductase-like Zn-dependent oxidoreductase